MGYACMLSHSFVSNSLQPHGLQPARLLCPWGLSGQEYQSGLPRSLPGALPNPGNEPRSPTLQADSLLSEPPGKTKNTGVGSLSLLQGLFPTQKLKQGLLHSRWKMRMVNPTDQLDYFILCLFHVTFNTPTYRRQSIYISAYWKQVWPSDLLQPMECYQAR